MFKAVAVLVFVSLMIGTIVLEYHQRVAFVKLQKLQRNHNQLLVHNKQLQTKYSEHSSFLKIEQQARESLEMVFPEKLHRL